jgi:hypothetical protein
MKQQDKEFTYYKNIDEKNLLNVAKNSNGSSSLLDNEAYRELYKSFSLTVNETMINDLDDIPHNKLINSKEYKYGLPSKNETPFSELVPVAEEPKFPNTSTENLFELLSLDKESSYESMLLKFKEEYSHGNSIIKTELDMYGNIVKAGETKHEVFEYGIPIPAESLKDVVIINRLRRTTRYNIDLPGNIEDVHPNKFIANLRPLEEFRHTPVVALNEKDILSHKKKVDERNRQGIYFEVKKQTLIYYSYAIIGFVVIYFLFKHLAKEGEKTHSELERIRLRRFRYREEEDIY